MPENANSEYTVFFRKEAGRTMDLFGAYTRESLLGLLKEAETLPGSAGISRRAELIKHMKKSGLEASLREPLPVLEKRIEEEAVTDEELEERLFSEMYRMYRTFPTASDYMERLVRRLVDPSLKAYEENGEEGMPSVRLLIVKQFLLKTSWHTAPLRSVLKPAVLKANPGVRERNLTKDMYAAAAEESLFGLLEEKGAEKKDYRLLKLAKNFERGRLIAQGSTRQDLFAFAAAFGMTFSPDEAHADPATDVEKNLFFDFYGNNLLRYLSEDYRKNALLYEAEPRGDSINFKNYAEAVWVWYLSRRDLSAEEKLKRAEKLIAKCRKEGAQAGAAAEEPREELYYTEDYKESFLSEMLSLPEESLFDYVRTHFVLPESTTASAVMAESDTRMAEEYYEDLRRKYMDLLVSGKPFRREWAEVLYREGRVGADLTGEEGTPFGDAGFSELLKRLDTALSSGFAPLGSGESVSRTRLIAAYYTLYINRMALRQPGLPEVWQTFAAELDPVLTHCRFQRLRTSGIFDLFTVFMAYKVCTLD